MCFYSVFNAFRVFGIFCKCSAETRFITLEASKTVRLCWWQLYWKITGKNLPDWNLNGNSIFFSYSNYKKDHEYTCSGPFRIFKSMTHLLMQMNSWTSKCSCCLLIWPNICWTISYTQMLLLYHRLFTTLLFLQSLPCKHCGMVSFYYIIKLESYIN